MASFVNLFQEGLEIRVVCAARPSLYLVQGILLEYFQSNLAMRQVLSPLSRYKFLELISYLSILAIQKHSGLSAYVIENLLRG